MPWRNHKRATCIVCGRPRDECGSLSRRGKCHDCGVGVMIDEMVQLVQHSGPQFEHWRRRCAASVGAVLLDDLPGSD